MSVEDAVKALGWIQPTQILLQDECDVAARAYILSLDVFLRRRSVDPPTWLRKMFEWGPVKRPVSWCDVPKARKADCGLLAALAREVYKARGVEAFQAQLIVKYPEHAVEHWVKIWRNKGAEPDWIWGNFVYHEVVVVKRGRVVEVYDPLLNALFNGIPQRIDRGIVVAFRVFGELKKITPGVWHLMRTSP